MSVAKQGDTLPPTTATCIGPDDEPEDLSQATVTFTAYERRGLKQIDGSASGDANGEATFTWTAEARDTPGVYRYEFEARWDDGRVLTFPNDGYNTLTIYPELEEVGSS